MLLNAIYLILLVSLTVFVIHHEQIFALTCVFQCINHCVLYAECLRHRWNITSCNLWQDQCFELVIGIYYLFSFFFCPCVFHIEIFSMLFYECRTWIWFCLRFLSLFCTNSFVFVCVSVILNLEGMLPPDPWVLRDPCQVKGSVNGRVAKSNQRCSPIHCCMHWQIL